MSVAAIPELRLQNEFAVDVVVFCGDDQVSVVVIGELHQSRDFLEARIAYLKNVQVDTFDFSSEPVFDEEPRDAFMVLWAKELLDLGFYGI